VTLLSLSLRETSPTFLHFEDFAKQNSSTLQSFRDFVLNRLALASKEGRRTMEQTFAKQTQNITGNTFQGVNVWH
jgi:hypothetical protein